MSTPDTPVRYICIHGHFYQPPRENPWLGTIEVQDSAYPYHDWNERITAECYEPNAYAHILDAQGRIERIANNYSRISFNFGPTLLSWLQSESPRVYQAILRADRESQQRFSGHGSAMAQAYNHIILPLANERDKRTQVRWGLRDFSARFGRAPEGMWLPETAVDTGSLEALASEGIRFTVLAPHQARAVRKIGSVMWQDVAGGRVDPRQAYKVQLPSGRSLTVLFYDGPVSRAVAFERLLNKGEDFAQRLRSLFPADRHGPQLVHMATDGETYGHHHTYGEMALAYALSCLEQSPHERLTNYGEFLERHPPQYEVQISENTAWSCAHGVGRWHSDCGCNSGGSPGWNQAWRAPLREALDYLRDALAPLYEQKAAQLLADPWAARDAYIDVILDGTKDSRERFLRAHARTQDKALGQSEQVAVWKLLELQRHTQLMYTSCGWFFDDISGPEATQNILYAARALQLGREVLSVDLEPQFLSLLARARSNLHDSEPRDGRSLYERQLRPTLVDLPKVGAHFALTSLFRTYEQQTMVHGYKVLQREYVLRQAGRVKLGLGRARIQSQVTKEATELSFAALHLGDHNLTGGVRVLAEDDSGSAEHAKMVQEFSQLFSRADVPEVLRALDRHFASGLYSLGQLFRDEQRGILEHILRTTLQDAEAEYHQMYEQHAPLLRFLAHLGVPRPPALQAAAQQALSHGLHRALRAEPLELSQVTRLLDETEQAGVHLDAEALRITLREVLSRLGEALRARPDELLTLQQLDAATRLAVRPPFQINLWRTQNTYYELLQTQYPQKRAQAAARPQDGSSSDEGAVAVKQWVELFAAIGERLKVRVRPPP
jgi:alpha-amylase/alpha-mannosidase (GH57 family)